MGSEVAMTYLTTGRVDQALLWAFNDYLPYGIMWVLIGLALFAVTYQKNRSMAVSGIVLSIFLAVVDALLPGEVQLYFTLVVAFLLFAVWWRVIK